MGSHGIIAERLQTWENTIAKSIFLLGLRVVQPSFHHHVAAKRMIKIHQTTAGIVNMSTRIPFLLDFALHPRCVQCLVKWVKPPLIHCVEFDLSSSGN